MHATDDTRWIMELDRGATLAFSLRQGMVVVCHRGSVWLTEYHPGVDIVLAAGERHTTTVDGQVVISSRGAAQIAISPVSGLLAGHQRLRLIGKALARLNRRLQLGGKTHEHPGAGVHDGTRTPAC
ncbi:MAG: DUF2917 domain-containing protein [Azoarcus sp.]|nr:DUF2917 domain-containing protein [Azoarcus sp.]